MTKRNNVKVPITILCELNDKKVIVKQNTEEQVLEVKGIVHDYETKIYLGLQDVTNAKPLNTEQSALK